MLNRWNTLFGYAIKQYQGHTRNAKPDFTKCDMFLDQYLCLPWNIVINQSDLKHKFIIFVKCRLTISVCCFYIRVIHLISSDFRDYSWVRLGLGVGKWSRYNFWIKMLFQGQQFLLTQEHI